MRIATWNCQDGLDKKLDVVETIDADIVIIQECAERTALGDTPGMSSIWSPPYPGAKKGTGVFCKGDWEIKPASRYDDLPWVLPVTLRNQPHGQDLTLLAMWTNTNKGDGRPPYDEQFSLVLERTASFLPAGRTLIAGDLNASMQGPSIEGHRRNLDRLSSLGMVSAYHHANGHEHGKEPEMTLKWHGRGGQPWFYHCDFIFVPRTLATGMSSRVVNTFDWPRRVSDHQPVVADMADT